MRFRNVYVVLGSLLVLLLWVLSDPDLGLVQGLGVGASTIAMLLFLSKGVLASALLFLTCKAIMDYKVADFEEVGANARRDPQGAGMYAIAIALTKVAYAIVIVGAFFS